MNTERKTVEPKAIIVIDKIAKASELNELTQGFEGDVIVTKKLILDMDINISCNLHVMGCVSRKMPMSESNININGDFYCYGEIHCNNINVTGYLYSESLIYSRNIKVGENLLCDTKINAFGCNIIVAGDFECKSVVAEEIRVLGEVCINGSISVAKAIKTGY